MTDHQAFLNAVIDRPDDDLLRLVYADFLEENGDEARAEFIRLQIEHAAADPESDGWADRDARVRQLLRANDWRIPNLRGKQEFRRGFVEAVHTTAGWLVNLDDAAFDSSPVRELRVVNARNYLEELAFLPWMRRLELLQLRNSDLGTGERMHQFFSRVELSRLRSLDMRNNVLWAEDLTTFFRAWPDARQLAALNLSGNPLGDEGMRVLMSQPLPNLRSLIFRTDDLPFSDCLHADGTVALANSAMTALEELDLRGHHIGDAGFIDLITSPLATTLRVLDVGFNDIGEAGDAAFDALTSATGLAELRVLRLNGNRLDELAADTLAFWPGLVRLAEVDVRRCRFSTGARWRLEQSPWAAKFVFGE